MKESPNELTPTPEQQAILEHVSSSSANLQINAYAGTGKTATLRLIQGASAGPILCLAFNKGVKEEMEESFGPQTTVKTLNGLGHSVWSHTCVHKVVLDQKKCQEILRNKIKALTKDERESAWEAYWEILSAVGLAKSLGYVPQGHYVNAKRLCSWEELCGALEAKPNPLQQALIDSVLLESIRQAYAGSIDFNDQVYMPALFGGTFPKYPLVLVDEAQDLSPANHAMLAKLKGSRVISVGDPYQSIYQFRGACQDGMAKLSKAFEMTELPLSVSWRCPSEIVKNARWRVPEFKWSRAGGQVVVLSAASLCDIEDGAAIICRNNAPLFRLAFSLISNGRSVSVAGSDIGPKLVGILRRFGDDNLPRSSVLGAIQDWADRKAEAGSKSAGDLAACMRLFAERASDLGQALAYAKDILQRVGGIRLTTGHKAKGLEWETVYHLDPWLINSGEQELNLRYVIQTRAKERYFEVNSKGIQ